MIFVQMFLSSLIWGCIYGLIGMGVSFIYRASGYMSFAQGEMLMLGAFFGMTFFKTFGLPFIVSLLLTMAIMFLFGVLVERVLIRTIVKLAPAGGDDAVGTSVVLGTIGLSIVLQNVALFVFGADVYRFPPIFGTTLISLGAINIVPEWILVLATTLIFSLVFGLFMKSSKFGIAMEAAAQSPVAAKSVGINTSMTTALTWGIAAVTASVAGVLVGPLQGVGISMGIVIGLKGFAGAVIGGYGETFGALLGGLIVGFVETFGGYLLPSQYKDILVFAVLILIIIVKPTGILNAKVYE